MIYYVDPSCGKDENDGLTPQTPKKNYTQFTLRGGDSLLFRRGSMMRERLITCAGEENAPITYGAYGEGEKPVICGSQSLSDPEKWVCEGDNVWVCDGFEDDETCNIIFNNSDLCGTLRWSREELCAQGDFYDNRFGYDRKKADFEPKIWLYSEKNPAEYYQSIEVALYTDRFLVQHADNIIIRDLHLINGGVHAIAGYFGARNVKVLNCDIERFGGKVWSLERKIRFGNGVEYWNIAENIEISGCYFNNIYDSAVTHQGAKTECRPCNNLVFRNNVFRYCGMAAYEQRDLFPLYAEFSGNVCIDAGEGFSKNGIQMPRNSEIYPQPMGHHLFLWRIESSTEGGKMVVKDNIFHNAPYGAAVYSIISQDAERQTDLENNTYYTENNELFTRLGGRNYKSFDEYKSIEKGIKYNKTDITKYIK